MLASNRRLMILWQAVVYEHRFDTTNARDDRAAEIDFTCGSIRHAASVDPVVMRHLRSKMFYVEIVKASSGEVVKRMGPMSERQADKVESGASINLNHKEYFTRIVSA